MKEMIELASAPPERDSSGDPTLDRGKELREAKTVAAFVPPLLALLPPVVRDLLVMFNATVHPSSVSGQSQDDVVLRAIQGTEAYREVMRMDRENDVNGKSDTNNSSTTNSSASTTNNKNNNSDNNKNSASNSSITATNNNGASKTIATTNNGASASTSADTNTSAGTSTGTSTSTGSYEGTGGKSKIAVQTSSSSPRLPLSSTSSDPLSSRCESPSSASSSATFSECACSSRHVLSIISYALLLVLHERDSGGCIHRRSSAANGGGDGGSAGSEESGQGGPIWRTYPLRSLPQPVVDEAVHVAGMFGGLMDMEECEKCGSYRTQEVVRG